MAAGEKNSVNELHEARIVDEAQYVKLVVDFISCLLHAPLALHIAPVPAGLTGLRVASLKYATAAAGQEVGKKQREIALA